MSPVPHLILKMSPWLFLKSIDDYEHGSYTSYGIFWDKLRNVFLTNVVNVNRDLSLIDMMTQRHKNEKPPTAAHRSGPNTLSKPTRSKEIAFT